MPRRDGAPRRSPHPPDLPVRADRRARPYRPRPVLEHRRAEPRVSLVTVRPPVVALRRVRVS